MTLPTTKLKNEVIESFREKLGKSKALSFDEYIEWALYGEKIGYYRREKKRIGRENESDFYTSSNMVPLWGELLVAACNSLLSPQPLSEFSFVEIAAEPNRSVLSGVKQKFKKVIPYNLGDSLVIPQHSIVFSNEWLDAQPFKRFIFSSREERWLELGVCLESGRLKETLLDRTDSITQSFPTPPVDNYLVDWPSGSTRCLSELLCNSQWTGLFLTFDYGLSYNDIFFQKPQGTARTYHRHQMDENLLQSPGEKDITCHLCWDPLKEILKRNGFSQISIERQESFFMNHAADKIKDVLVKSKGTFSPKLQSLKELIHPQHFGNKFQALSGIRL